MIKVQHLSKHYGSVKAVDGISFDVAEQENLVLLGTSGCGKTTTLKMLNRLIEPTKGQMQINGKDILNGPPEILRRGIGYVLQNIGLFPHYTIAENIAVVPKLMKWEDKRVKNRMHELLEKLHLPNNLLNAYPNQLSGGQQQRVGLARALMADPPVLLMDEPFGALDEITRHKLDSDLLALWREQKLTVVFVTHSIHEAVFLSNRVVMMAARPGRIVEQVVIDEPHPRTPDFMVTPRFAQYAKHLQDSLLGASRANGEETPS